jgi:outer membrane lipopolysaccharide assembly protein LptE/RlpB
MIKKYSYLLNAKLSIYCLFCIFILGACYSFTGGSIPEHLNTIYITSVTDNSGYGNPAYREMLFQLLVTRFQKDNSLKLVDRDGDAKLSVRIKSIKDEMQTVSASERETERKIVLTCEAEYYDAVKKKSIWKKNFSNYEIYDLNNAMTERERAINNALEQTTDDILLAVVSGW